MLAATSGVVRAAIAANRTSSVERLAGSGCILIWMAGLAAFHCWTICCANWISSGFDDGQNVMLVWATASEPISTATTVPANVVRSLARPAGGSLHSLA